MSYCRWSSDDWQCDVYVYEDVGGWWQTYVAGRKRRLREGVEFPPPVDSGAFDEWFARSRVVDAILHDANEGALWDWVDLPEPHAGASYQDATPGECADRLEMLRAVGLHVPQYAIDALREEADQPIPSVETKEDADV